MRAIDRLIEKNNRGECDEIEKAILSCYYDGSPSQAVRAAEQYAQQCVQPTCCTCRDPKPNEKDYCLHCGLSINSASG